MTGGRLRCVYDCVVLLQAAATPTGPAGRCVAAVSAGRVELHVSRVTVRELRDVLHDPRVRRRFPAMTDRTAADFIEKIRWRAVVRRDVPHRIELPRDPRDEPYLDLAVAADADRLVTRDRDLLDLAGGRDPAAAKLRQLALRLRVVTPEGLLVELRP